MLDRCAPLLAELPMALFLACVLSAMWESNPAWARWSNGLAMRMVSVIDRAHDSIELPPYWLRQQLPESWFEHSWRPFRSKRFDAFLAPASGQAAPRATIVSLTPAAHAKLLKGMSPMPRRRLACVIAALTAQLDRLHTIEGQKVQRPVVAIDIDLSPVTSDRAPAQDLADCAELLTTVIGEADAALQSDDELMVAVLRRLARTAKVTSLTFPRVQRADQQRRNQFIADTCCQRPPDALSPWTAVRDDAACVHFASPLLFSSPLDLVYEYPTHKKNRTELGSAVASADAPDSRRLPNYFPGLGQVAASLYGDQAPDPNVAFAYCRGKQYADKPYFDDDLMSRQNEPGLVNAFKYEIMQFGAVRNQVEYFDVDSAEDSEVGLGKELSGLMEKLQRSSLYFLTVDTGTTEDKFVVPAEEGPVPGAWVHGVTALTEIARSAAAAQAAAPPESRSRSIGYFSDVIRDVFIGLLFAVTLQLTLGRLPRRPNPVLHDLLSVAWPLILLLAYLYVELAMFSADDFAKGVWRTPAPIFLGLWVGHFISGHRPVSERDDGHVLHRSARRTQLLAQWAWASAIVVACFYGTDVDVFTGAVRWFAGGVLGAMYVVLARRQAWFPLPWR